MKITNKQLLEIAVGIAAGAVIKIIFAATQKKNSGKYQDGSWISKCGKEKLQMVKGKIEMHKSRLEKHLQKINSRLGELEHA